MGGSDNLDEVRGENFAFRLRVLSAGRLDLEPFHEGHVEGIFACTPEETFDFYPIKPLEWSLEGFGQYLELLVGRGFFGLTALVDGEVVGFSAFLDVRTEHRGLEIGHTFLSPDWRGSWLNPAMKRLMIGQAIEEFGAVRVQFKTDARNLASRKAMEGMRFPYEGIWKNHLVMPDGYLRDSVYFAVTPESWPEVRAHLDLLIESRGG